MSKLIIFVQVHDRAGIIEAELPKASTLGDFYDALKVAGVELDTETFIFVGESEQHVSGERHDPILGLVHGCRIHISRCARIKTTVHYLEKPGDREFSPGTRLRTVKEWAVAKFELNPKDAAEHVLQLCKSTERPSSDTPLQQLVSGHHGHDDHGHGNTHGHDCAICFDLVPDKRVEG
jgi:hypothetical protein